MVTSVAEGGRSIEAGPLEFDAVATGVTCGGDVCGADGVGNGAVGGAGGCWTGVDSGTRYRRTLF